MTRYACCLLLGLLLPLVARAQGATPLQSRSRIVVPRSVRDRSLSDTMGTPFIVAVPNRITVNGVKLDPTGRVFAALAAAYDDLKIPTTLRDSAGMMVGNDLFSLRGGVGGKSLSIYFECGADVNGVFADIYRISTSLVSFVTPMPADSVEVRTVLFATAVDIPKAIPTKDCKSTGELEKKVFTSMLKKLAKP